MVIKIIRQVLELLNNSLIANRISMASIGRLCVANQFPGRARCRGLGDGTLRSVLAGRGPFFFKQWGGTNKKKAGRVLEGRTWDEMPRGPQKSATCLTYLC